MKAVLALYILVVLPATSEILQLRRQREGFKQPTPTPGQTAGLQRRPGKPGNVGWKNTLLCYKPVLHKGGNEAT